MAHKGSYRKGSARNVPKNMRGTKAGHRMAEKLKKDKKK